jgi:hypothetical protein
MLGTPAQRHGPRSVPELLMNMTSPWDWKLAPRMVTGALPKELPCEGSTESTWARHTHTHRM